MPFSYMSGSFLFVLGADSSQSIEKECGACRAAPCQPLPFISSLPPSLPYPTPHVPRVALLSVVLPYPRSVTPTPRSIHHSWGAYLLLPTPSPPLPCIWPTGSFSPSLGHSMGRGRSGEIALREFVREKVNKGGAMENMLEQGRDHVTTRLKKQQRRLLRTLTCKNSKKILKIGILLF